ncbi:hypothetical protein [Saccharopolyspora hattusasensis]|uniref:hypothetical protein n=1 Tax=Saccharopolyspora hattusasensis TaxID=1128679 RepID=UPI003D973D9F
MTALRAKVATYQLRLEQLGDLYGDGEITKAEWLRQRARVADKLEAATAELDATGAGSVLDGVANAARPSEAFRAQSIARQRAIMDAVMTITVGRAKPGRLPRGVELDYGRITLTPKTPATSADPTPESVPAA